MRSVTTWALGFLCLVFSLHAEETQQDTSKIVPANTVKPSETVSISGAYWRSVLHTTVPIIGGAIIANQGDVLPMVGGITVLYGVFIGPSMGNFYVEDYSGGIGGIAWRAGGAVAAVFGFAIAIGCAFSDDGDGCNGEDPAIAASLIGGAAAYVGGTIWQLWRIPRHARQKNRLGLESVSPSAQNKITALSWNLSPTWDPTRQAIGAQFALNLPGL